MEYLPPEEEQKQLIAALAALLQAKGQEHFLTAPILEPTEDYFPDRWTPDAAGVKALARRLLSYCGLPELRVNVTLYQNPDEAKTLDPHGKPGATERHGAAAWYAGMPEGVCQFGAEEHHLENPEEIVACMCHEVAHAYRDYHRLQDLDRDLEECLTDLTAVYLGFGVFSANAAYLYRAKVLREGGLGASRYSHQQIGYLSPQSLCFLLAAQATARGTTPKEKKKIAGLLETNQRAYFKASLSRLEGQREALCQRLGLSQEAQERAKAPAPLATKNLFWALCLFLLFVGFAALALLVFQ